MNIVNMHDAKSRLSTLVTAVESGDVEEVVIARNGRPAARLVALRPERRGVRLGLAKGKFVAPDDIDTDNDLVAEMFYGTRP